MDDAVASFQISEPAQQDEDDVGARTKRIPVAEPDLGGNELKYVTDCLASTWISSARKYIQRFEDTLAAFCDARYAISTNNGTTALPSGAGRARHRPGRRAHRPTLTYIASANAVTYCGATPVFADSDPVAMTLDTCPPLCRF